jgi:hypothetical protein
MNSKILLPLLSFLVLLFNQIYGLFYNRGLVSERKIILFFSVLLIMILLFLWDYWFNYRKKRGFSFSPFIFLVYSTLLWVVEVKGPWYMIAINLLLLIGFTIYDRTMKLRPQ